MTVGRTLADVGADEARGQQIEAIDEVLVRDGIQYIYFQHVSVGGRVVGKGIPASEWRTAARDGLRLPYQSLSDMATSESGDFLEFGADESELTGIADLSTFAQLPWDGRLARVFCDCYDSDSGGALEADPRQNLRREIARTEDAIGGTVLCGIEPEMMWLHRQGNDHILRGVTKPRCYHIEQFEELREILLDVVDYMSRLGLRPIHGDHEDAPGQLELNFHAERPLQTADNLMTYRQVCAAVARQHGVIATFMPKPFDDAPANGAHHHLTAYDGAGSDLFGDARSESRLSSVGRAFVAGILEHAAALSALTAPTVNSYRRFWKGGPWAPRYRSYGWQNRTCVVRVAATGRFEFRSADAACNPYLSIAALLAAGADGIARNLDPGPPVTGVVSTHIARAGALRMPVHLGEALDALESDPVVRAAVPGRLGELFLLQKRREWADFLGTVTEWDVRRYLDGTP